MWVHPSVSAKQTSDDFPYYRPVWRKVILILLAVSFVPLVVIGGGVSYYAFFKLETLTLETLHTQVLSHQEAIDRFLGEREKDLRLIAGLYTLPELTQPGNLERILTALRHQAAGFLDLGVIDMQGNHLVYAGPFDLISMNYAGETWFQELLDKESHISDVYLGFRQLPHFIMAVRQGRGEASWILRATIDSEYFDALVSAGPALLKAKSYIINREGLLQTNDQTAGPVLTPAQIHSPPDTEKIQMTAMGNDLVFTIWQKKVPWLNVVQVKRNDVYLGLNQVRLLVIITFVAGGIVVIGTVLWTTGKLISMLEAKGQSLRLLDKQLRRTSYLSSSMELSMGFFAEIKDLLANIDLSVQWLTRQGPGDDPSEKRETVALIAGEATRGHALVEKFMQFVRADDPVVTDVPVNELLDDLLSFLHKELVQRDIRIVHEYREPRLLIRSDRSKLRQIFQNLLLNAMAALDQGGQIRVVTRCNADRFYLDISDNGPGIAPADQARIFEPLFTTKTQGTGLGLTICVTILDQLGGKISVDSQPGQGATFTVELPCRISAQG
jgi:two-component system, NtrC family, sensor kinase